MGVNALQEMGLSTSFFMYAPVGIPMLLMGIIYFVFIGYRFLPNGKEDTGATVEKQKDFNKYYSRLLLQGIGGLKNEYYPCKFSDKGYC